MKQFRFRLDTVLNYKQQTLDNRLIEHGLAVSKAKRQEEVLDQVRNRLADCEAEYEQKKAEGMTVLEAVQYQNGIAVLERAVNKEAETLKKLRRIEEEKRMQVVEAKKETSTLEKLREIKREEYDSAMKKAEEKMR